jgi:predicted ATP-dependent Lon-type protease
MESGAKELIKHRIVERGEYTLLGPLSLVYDQRRLHYWADVPALGMSGCPTVYSRSLATLS